MKIFTSRYLLWSFAAIVVASFMFPDVAFATEQGKSPTLENFGQIASQLVHVLTAAALLIIQFMPPVWGTDLITGDQIIEGLRPMWKFIRNAMNLVFVIVLILVAFANMLSNGGKQGGSILQNWSIKSKLGPIILGLVAINFSLLMVKVLADAVYVVTTAIFSVADQAIASEGVQDVNAMFDMEVDTTTFERCKKKHGGSGGKCEKIRKLLNNTYCGSKSTEKSPCFFKIKDKINVTQIVDPEKKNVVLAFGFFFMHLEMLPIVAAKAKNVFDVLDDTLFSLIMAVAYLLAMIAAFIVMLIRVLMMWVFILLSPILVTAWVLGWTSQIGKLNEQFWAYLIVPVKIAAAFTFSFILIAVLDGITPSPEHFTGYVDPGPPLKKFWGTNEGWKFVWKIFTVMLFWKTVFWAMEGLEGAQAITDKIQGFGTQLGKTALAFGADQIPIGGGKTAASLLSSTGNPVAQLSALERAATETDGSQTPGELLEIAKSRTKGAEKADKALSGVTKSATGLKDALSKLSESDLKSYLSDSGRLKTFKNTFGKSAKEISNTDISGMSADEIVRKLKPFIGTSTDSTSTPAPTTTTTEAKFDEAKLAEAMKEGLSKDRVMTADQLGLSGVQGADALAAIREKLEPKLKPKKLRVIADPDGKGFKIVAAKTDTE